MSQADTPFEYGGFWLDKRRDGKSPDIWQIAWKVGRAIHIKSTGCRTDELDAAKAKLVAHALGDVSKKPNIPTEHAHVFTLFKNYWLEHGKDAVSPGQIESSLRVFIGFLLGQDDLGPLTTVTDLTSDVFERFIAWRQREHTWEVAWFGKTYKHTAKPVKGESVKRNLDDIKAAISHNVKRGRIKPIFIPSVHKSLRSPPRDTVLTIEQLGAIVGYAEQDSFEFYCWIALMLGTAVRPEAALAFKPDGQLRGDAVDLHPPAWQRTKKVNPVVPLIPQLAGLMPHWPEGSVTSRKTAWRTMRRALDLPDNVFPKTIRHTVATMLLDMAMLGDGKLAPMHIEALLGHKVVNSITGVYAKWNVRHLEPVRPALSAIWTTVHEAANEWSAGHLLDTGQRGQHKKVA